jgi:hypothetical protein
MVQKLRETISIQNAVANITAIASIELKNPGPIGIRGDRLVTSEEEGATWLSAEGVEPILEMLDRTYESIAQHLAKIGSNKALMDLVGESPAKMEAYLAIRLGHPLEKKISERESFKELQRFYQEQAAEEVESIPEGSDQGLKDFESVKRDVEYELFYIRNEAGKPYFNAELLRNIKLSCDFSLEGDSFEEDPLLKIRAMQDRDLHASAAQIVHDCYPLLSDYFQVAKKLEENQLSQSLSMAVIALFLAANSRYLIQNTTGKSCLNYFEDFHRFLRRAMKTSEYQKLIAYPDSGDKNGDLLLNLTHTLARKFFERAGGVKMESIGLIHRSMRKGEEIKQKSKEPLYKGESLWNQLMLDDEKFRTLLSKFPNGPLFKVLDLVREEQDEDVMIPFDPLAQQNLPGIVFKMERKNREIEVLRLPCPTRQSLIHKAEVADEFKGFLRGLPKAKKLLVVNLQDRTSWREYARCKAIETLPLNAEFSQQIAVLTLPKDTDFYHQNHEYLNLNSAAEFLKAFQEQLASAEQCGYFFPPQMKPTEVARFADVTLPLIHEHFFDNKNSLTRKNREDFIEIFYQLLIIKCIDMLEPSLVAFSCKDAVDTTSAELACFYGFVKGDPDPDFLRWLLYTPALFVRERALNPERFNRAVSMLERIAGEKQGSKVFQSLFSHSLKLN